MAGATLLGAVDASSAQATPLSGYGPLLVGAAGLGGIWADPAAPGRVIVAHEGVAIVRLETMTGNAMLLSLLYRDWRNGELW